MEDTIIYDDMGNGNSLKITFEDDGDAIISIIDVWGNVVGEVQICTSGTINPTFASRLKGMIMQFKGL